MKAAKVRVHFNLHRRDWSVVAMSGPDKNRVIAHTSVVSLTDCTFRVSEASRQKVLAKKCRSVHAWVFGLLAPDSPVPLDAVAFTYNPYKGPTCTLRETRAPITTASAVWFTGHKAYAITTPNKMKAKLTRDNTDISLWYCENDIYFYVKRVTNGTDADTYEFGTVRYETQVGDYANYDARGQDYPTFEEAL